MSFRVGYRFRYQEIVYVCVAIIPCDYYIAILKNGDEFLAINKRRDLRSPIVDGTSHEYYGFTVDGMSENYQEIVDWNTSKKFPSVIQSYINIISKNIPINTKSSEEFKKDMEVRRDEQLSMELRCNESTIKKLEDRNTEIRKIQEMALSHP